MAEFYFPFASLNGDRETNDTHFARFYSNLFRDGVIAPVKGALKVSEDEVLGSRVLVDAGAMLIDGRQYMLTEPRTVQIKPAESTGDRTDLVVVRLDLNARLIELRYLENATNPVRTEQIWDMVLARISVPRNATEIKNADITDMRANDAVCGYSTPYEEIRASGLEQQYQSLLEQSFDSFEQHAQRNKQDLEQYLTDQQLLFDSWFSSVKNILDENVATNLLNMINAHELKEATETELGHVRLSDIPTPTKEAVGLGNVNNVKQASKEEFDVLATSLDEHQAEKATQDKYGHIRLQDIPTPTKASVGLSDVDNVKQASKAEHDQLATDFDAHQVDDAIHLTESERVEWNSKASTYFSPGDVLVFHNPTMVSSPDSLPKNTPKLIMSCVLGRGGEVRVTYSLDGSTEVIVYGQIYRNGVPVGQLFQTVGSTTNFFTEDIGGWEVGDSLELWANKNNITSTAGVNGAGDLKVSVLTSDIVY